MHKVILSRKLFPFIKDFLLQSIIFFICVLSPYGGDSLYIGKFDESILFRILKIAEKDIGEAIYSFFYTYLITTIVALLPSVSNYLCFAYINSSKKYYVLKVTAVIVAANAFYIFLWMLIDTLELYRNLLFPVFTTMVLYAIYKFYRLRNVKPGNT